MISRPSHKTICLLFLCLLTSRAWTQQQAQLTGIIRDPTGASVSGVALTLNNDATSATLKSTTNSSGIYSFPSLAPGSYTLTAEAKGFKRLTQSGLLLETGTVHTVDFALTVGDINESATVEGKATRLEAQDATLGQLIERQAILNMPMESRRAASLVKLAANIAYSGETGANVSPKFSAAGGRSQNQNWYLDGGIGQQVALSTPILIANPPAESLQEFKVETSNYGVELGRSAGGVIVMTTRSGGSQFHGAAYEFLRNDALDARTFFAAAKAPLRYNVFGASFGGPIHKNRTFVFLNYEGSRRTVGSTLSYIVPRPAEVLGDFSARKDVKILDPQTKQQFANNVVPQSRFDAVGAKLAALFPTPNLATDSSKAAGVDFSTNVSDPTNFNVGIARVDHTFSDRDRVFVRYFQTASAIIVSNAFPNAFADSRAQDNSGTQKNTTATYIRTFSAARLNELRYTFISYSTSAGSLGASSGANSQLGVLGADPDGFPSVSVTGYQAMGSRNQVHSDGPTRQQGIADNLTMIEGRHEIKFGFEYRYGRNVDNTQALAGGQLGFSNRATGDALAALLLGWTTSAALQTSNLLTTRMDNYAAFVQETFHVTPNLSITAGLRYDLDTPVWEINNRQNGFDGTQINPVSKTPGVVTFAGVDGRSQYANDFFTKGFGPRVALAWRFSPSWVARAGYGIFYNPVYGDPTIRALTLGFGQSLSLTSVDGGLTPVFRTQQGFPAVAAPVLGPGLGAVATGQTPTTSVGFIPKDEKPGYSQQFNFTVQRELFRDTLIEVAGLGNVGHHLAGPDESINQIPLVNGRGPATQSQALRPYPQYSDVIMMTPPWGNSSYYALSVKAEKRYSRGFNLLASYTWSKFLDDVQAQQELAAPTDNGYTHIALRGLNKALSGNDMRNRFVLSGLYDIYRGWGIGTALEMHSGQPFDVVEQTNTTNTFSDTQRPNVIGNPVLDTGRPLVQKLAAYFNTAAYANPGTGNFGNASRAAGIGPGYSDVDLSLYKQWSIREQMKLRFRADFFNALNRANFANPAGLQGRGDFGVISTTVGTGREVQLSLRVEF